MMKATLAKSLPIAGIEVRPLRIYCVSPVPIAPFPKGV